MGTSSSLAALGTKIDQIQQAFDGRALRRVTERVGQRSKPVAARAISPAGLSHWGRGAKRGGAKVAAKYKLLSDHEVAMQPTVPPLAALLELGSYKAGGTWRKPKRRGSARRRRGSVGTYSRANVPARGAWSKASPPVEQAAPGFVDDEVQAVLRRII